MSDSQKRSGKGRRAGKQQAETLAGKRKKRSERLRYLKYVLYGLLIITVLVAVGYFLLHRDNKNISVVENGIGSIVTTVQGGATTLVTGIRDTVTDLANYGSLKSQLTDLQHENDTLKIQLNEAQEALQENERLKTLLEAKSEYDALDPVYAKVIAHTPGAWFDTFSVNRGTMDGISVGMAVITADGLVGRVYDVGLSYAKVLSVIDPRSAVATLIERTRDNGVMRGEVTSASTVSECYVYYLPNINSVVPGDTIITSGMDAIYPKGIPVGVVTEVTRDTDASNQFIVVQPFVDFNHIEEVLILRETVETDTEELTVVPTPTPVPIITPTPAPTVSGAADEGEVVEDDGTWTRPTMPPAEGSESPFGTVAPMETVKPADLSIPEDIWAKG